MVGGDIVEFDGGHKHGTARHNRGCMAGRPPPNKPKQRRAEGTVGHMSAVGQVRCRDILLTRGQGCHLKRTVDTVAKLLDVCESPALLASDWYYVRRSPLDTEEAVCRAEDAGGSRELPRTRGHRPCDSSAACAVGRPMLTEGGRLALKRDPLSNSGLAPIIDESVHVLRRDSVLFLLDDENNVERIMIYSTRAGALGDEERKAEYRAQQPELRKAGELLTEMWDEHHVDGKMLQRQVGALPGQDIGQAMFQARDPAHNPAQPCRRLLTVPPRLRPVSSTTRPSLARQSRGRT